MKSFIALAVTLASAASPYAHAQTSKSGLWEVTSKMGGNPEMEKAMADMQKQMASMPPEQRKQMEAMMGKQGVTLSGAGGVMVMKSCVTKEMVEQSQLPLQTQGNCTSTTSEKTSTSIKFKYACTNPASSGEGEFNFPNDSSYTSKLKIINALQGKVQTNTIDGSGRWLGTDCGTVKPIALPKGTAGAKP